MQIIADLQLHSRFARAVSKEMNFPNMYAWAKRKGIDLLATGDWTHPMWFREIERDLEETGNGLLRLKPGIEHRVSSIGMQDNIKRFSDTQSSKLDPQFLLATEVSCIYSQGGRVHRVHTLIWVPTIEAARKISQEMTKRGCNLMSDGRPIVGLTSIQIAELVFTIEPKALVIPAHIWTPWFSVFGSLGGFDSIDEAFGPYAKNIYAVETGLSSNPAMNWRIKELDNRAILSFSDAHSLLKLGREATVFEVSCQPSAFSYQHIYDAIINSAQGDEFFLDPLLARQPSSQSHPLKGNFLKDGSTGVELGKRSAKKLSPLAASLQPRTYNQQPHIAYTIEFYPEEGKYHYTGHRACNIRYTPEQTAKKGKTCPVCGKSLTVGVMERVEALAGRSETDLQLSAFSHQLSAGGAEMNVIASRKYPKRPPFVMLVPLQEILSECIGSPVLSPKVQGPYMRLTDEFGSEFNVLLRVSLEDIRASAGERVATGIEKVRRGDLHIDPGYDGVFGVVKLWREDEEKPLVDSTREQLSLL